MYSIFNARTDDVFDENEPNLDVAADIPESRITEINFNIIEEELIEDSDGVDISEENSIDDVSEDIFSIATPVSESDIDGLTISITEEKQLGDFTIQSMNYFLDFGPVESSKGIRYLLGVDVNYPQIKTDGLIDEMVENDINSLLKMIPFEVLLENSYEEVLQHFYSLMNFEGTPAITAIWSNYEIKFLDTQLLSLSYDGSAFFGRIVRGYEFMLTIDLKSGNILFLENIIDINTIIPLIEKGEYEVVAGDYMPGFGSGKEPFRRTEFVEAFTKAMQRATKNDKYVPYNSNNFCVDNTHLYIYFYYSDSLHDYMILKLNLDDLDIHLYKE